MLYTYASDKTVGDIEGNNLHVVLFGDLLNGQIIDLPLTGGSDSTAGGSGLYWHIVTFFY